MVARLGAAAVANDPSAVLVVVSDHGFMNISHYVNLAIPFVQAGLVQAAPNPQSSLPMITSWKAEPWLAGGMAAIMLHDPSDDQTEQQVRTLLDKLAADPNNGIAAVLDRDAIAKHEAFPTLRFWLFSSPAITADPRSAATSSPRFREAKVRTASRRSTRRCAHPSLRWGRASPIIAIWVCLICDGLRPPWRGFSVYPCRLQRTRLSVSGRDGQALRAASLVQANDSEYLVADAYAAAIWVKRRCQQPLLIFEVECPQRKALAQPVVNTATVGQNC